MSLDWKRTLLDFHSVKVRVNQQRKDMKWRIGYEHAADDALFVFDDLHWVYPIAVTGENVEAAGFLGRCLSWKLSWYIR